MPVSGTILTDTLLHEFYEADILARQFADDSTEE
jgi:hypothetical protein